MGILDNIKGLKPGGASAGATAPKGPGGASRAGAGAAREKTPSANGGGSAPGGRAKQSAASLTRAARSGSDAASSSKVPGRRKRKGAPASPRERVAAAAAPLHDRRRRLVGARETTLRDLGGLMLEMYKRNRFREELLLDKCEEVLAIEVEIAHVDQRLFQLAPPNAAGMRPIGRCECGAPIHPGQNFCGVCGRSFATLTQPRSCARCGAGLRPGDQFCASCGNEAPDALQTIEAGPGGTLPAAQIDAASVASKAVAETVVIDAPVADAPPPLEDVPAPAAAAAAAAEADSVTPPDVVGTTTAPAGFDWATPPTVDEAAIDTAVAAMPASPTDPATPFAGFPLSSTVPPPPIVDPVDVTLPTEPAVAIHLPDAAPPTASSAADVTPAAAADPASLASPKSDDAKAAKAAKAAERAARKAEAAAEKQRLKEARARAKAKARQARAARKRGGDG